MYIYIYIYHFLRGLLLIWSLYIRFVDQKVQWHRTSGLEAKERNNMAIWCRVLISSADHAKVSLQWQVFGVMEPEDLLVSAFQSRSWKTATLKNWTKSTLARCSCSPASRVGTSWLQAHSWRCATGFLAAHSRSNGRSTPWIIPCLAWF